MKNICLLLTLSFLSISTYAKRPNDSCALGFRVGTMEFYRCANGYFKKEYNEVEFSNVSKKDFQSAGDSLLLSDKQLYFDSSNLKADVKVPNDSCAIAMYIGVDEILRCDQGYFKGNKQQGFVHFDPAQWNESLGSITESDIAKSKISEKTQIVACKRTDDPSIVNCDDGDYKKVESFDGELEKIIRDQENSESVSTQKVLKD